MSIYIYICEYIYIYMYIFTYVYICIYCCDCWRQYWDETSNNTIDNELVEAARLGEIKGIYQNQLYDQENVEECQENIGKAHMRVRWLDINKGDEKDKEYRSILVVQEMKRDNREDLSVATPALEEQDIVQLGSNRRISI